MQRIISHIEYLLDHYECVILPGVGAFIKRHQSAVIDTTRHIILPPHISISFNGDLCHDDGLLASSYSRALGIAYTEAVQLVNNDIQLLRNIIANAGQYRLGEIGTISITGDNRYLFLPSHTTFITQGLRLINTDSESEEIENNIQTTILPSTRQYGNIFHRAMKYAAMLIMLLGVGIILSTTHVSSYDDTIVKASMCPIEAVQNEFLGEEQYPELLIAMPVIQEEFINSNNHCNENRYCLVIASLATIDQAHKFMTEAGNDVAGMYESNGRYRVYALTGPTASSVNSDKLADKYPGAWICALP